MVFTLGEIVDILVMVAAVGYIFMNHFRAAREQEHDPLLALQSRFDWQGFATACIVTAPGIILHEFGHKLVAIAMGLQATFQAAYGWLGLGVLLKFIGAPFIFFVPAYVEILGRVGHLQSALIAFAGPAINLLIAAVAYLVLKYGTHMSHRTRLLWFFTRQVNVFLFIFNMIPLPLFDGFKVFSGIIAHLIS